MVVAINTNFLFQNLVVAGEATLTNYRIFMGYQDTATIAGSLFAFESRSTSVLKRNLGQSGATNYKYGAKTLIY